VKPAFGNILLWRALAREDGELHVFGIRCGLGTPSVIPGQNSRIFRSVDEALQALQLPPTSLQARDVRRFFHFSGDWVGPHPLHEHQLMDLRYAMLPQQIQPLWGIQLDPSAPEKGAQWIQQTGLTQRPWAELWQLIMGRASLPAD
jgi:inner membrane protein